MNDSIGDIALYGTQGTTGMNGMNGNIHSRSGVGVGNADDRRPVQMSQRRPSKCDISFLVEGGG